MDTTSGNRSSRSIAARIGWIVLLIVVLSADLNRVAAADDSAFGLERRIPWTTSRVVGTPDPPLPYTTEPFLPQLPLKNPLFVIAEPGTPDLLVILQGSDSERSSRILRVSGTTADPTSTPLLEVPRPLVYSVAFHPEYRTNGFLYVFANGGSPRTNRVSRFTVDRGSPRRAVPESELVLLEWRSEGHDGGGLGFGRDGMLYLSTGDGTSDSDGWDSGQSLNDLLGSVLRIDVDHPDPGRPYGIPSDNPYFASPGARGELWAIGLRNPWRLCTDRESGQVWVGNNGQDLWESAHLIRRGENYGWSVFEGSHPFYRNRKQGPGPIVAPTFEHPHSEARSLTGGVVYRGSRFPELDGAYLYGDHSTGRIWAGRHDGQRVLWHRELAATSLQITSFGVTSDGEILITDLGSGLHRLIAAKPATRSIAFPRRLSETGIFSSTKTLEPQPGVLPYSVNAPGWMDGAAAERHLALPGNSRIRYASNRGWGFEDGAVLVQTVGFPGPDRFQRVETRILTRQDGRWAGYSYRWNSAQTDADLVDAAGQDFELLRPDPETAGGTRSQRWRIPSRAECMTCHSRAVEFVLGLSEVQMNRDQVFAGGIRDNQLRTLEHIGLFTQPLPSPPETLAHLVDPYSAAAPLEERARSYLHANCSVCHVEAGGGNARMQLEFAVARDRMELIGARPQHDSFGIRDAMLVAPGRPDQSVLIHRLSRRGPGQMPPLVSGTVDTAAVRLMREWIASLPAPRSVAREWTPADFAEAPRQLASGRSFKAGKAAFQEAGCIQCHRMQGEGGSVGPDLTTVGQRQSAAGILESVLLPSKVIAPEYAQTEVETGTGETLVGWLESENDTVLVLRPAGAEAALTLEKTGLKSRRLSPVSNMPEGMLNTLEYSQVLDLVAYLLACGNSAHPVFQP